MIPFPVHITMRLCLFARPCFVFHVSRFMFLIVSESHMSQGAHFCTHSQPLIFLLLLSYTLDSLALLD